MDFFSLQDDAFARSRKFYMAFSVAIFLAVIVLYLAITASLAVIFGGGDLPPAIYGYPQKVLSLRPFLILGSVITIIILFISVRRTSFIREGGGAYIAEILDARFLESPANLQETQLMNVVEEMAVAAGLPRPRLYIIPGARSINAITAGVDHDDAIIAVTEGAVRHLNRDEMQGVIAHEFAHILNGDYSLNLTMAGWLYGLMFFYIQGRRLLHFVWVTIKSFTENNNVYSAGTGLVMNPSGLGIFVIVPAFVTGCLLMAGGWIGKAGGQVLQAAFSRQREYLADAFAVQFTRNPHGLAGAMKKIAWIPRHGFIKSSDAVTMQAFFIASPVKLRSLFQSHPPLEDRIQALDPAWDGTLPEIDHDDFRPPKDLNLKYRYGPSKDLHFKSGVKQNKQQQKLADKVKKMDSWSGVLVLSLLQTSDEYSSVQVDDSLKAAHELYDALPVSMREAADDVGQVAILVAAVFVHSDAELKRRQKLVIEKRLGDEAAARAMGLKSQMEEKHRLPLLSLASPTLKTLIQEDKDTLSRLIKNLVAVDGKLDLFEIAACQILKKSLGAIFPAGKDDQKAESVKYYDRVRQEVVTVVSLLAGLDAQSETEAQAVFSSAMSGFKQWPPQRMLPRQQISSKLLMSSLDFLSEAPLQVRKTLIRAAASACLNKENLTIEQYQLLRALAAAVDVALPLTAVKKVGA